MIYTIQPHPTFERDRVITANGQPIGLRSARYTLVKPDQLDAEAAKHGMQLVSRRFSRSGKKSFTQYAGSGDVAGYLPRLSVFDCHTGGASFKIDIGMLRLVCTNGMVAGKVVSSASHRHLGRPDGGAEWLGEFFAEQVRLLKLEFDRAVQRVESRRSMLLDVEHVKILDTLTPGLRKEVDSVAKSYTEAQHGWAGPWAYIQALTDVARSRQPVARMRLEGLAAALVDA